jgi:hypothetical protein
MTSYLTGSQTKLNTDFISVISRFYIQHNALLRSLMEINLRTLDMDASSISLKSRNYYMFCVWVDETGSCFWNILSASNMRFRSFAFSEMSVIFGSCLEWKQPRAKLVQKRTPLWQSLIPSKTRPFIGVRKKKIGIWPIRNARCFAHRALLNRLTPNDPYMGRTAPLTSKCCISYIYSTNTRYWIF